MKEMRSTADRAKGSLAAHCREVTIDLAAGTWETGQVAACFGLCLVVWLLAPIAIPFAAWYRRRSARQEVAAWEARNAHEISASDE